VRTSGYSGTPLARKLGVEEGAVVWAIGAPDDYEALLAPLPSGVRIVARGSSRPAFVHLFTTKRADLVRRLPALRERLATDGVLWVSWPKRASGVPSDVTEDSIREIALPLGFVDVKVCAVDETWSGLKLVIRKELRR
jgi:hypothetical protein